MKIPKKLKIGGKIYTVEITDKLYLGSANCSAEIMYNDLVIRICPQADGKMQSDLMHEMVHAIYDNLGYKEQDEKRVEEMAQALYAVIVDNPEMFEEQKDVTDNDVGRKPSCRVCERITDANKDIFWTFARTHQPEDKEEFVPVPARYCPACGREIGKETVRKMNTV